MKFSIETPSIKQLNKLIKKGYNISKELDAYKIVLNEFNELQAFFNKKTLEKVVVNKKNEKEIEEIINKYKNNKNNLCI